MFQAFFNSSTDSKKNNRPLSRGFCLALIIVVVLAIGVLCFTVGPAVALFSGQLTGDQYVEITTTFYEYAFQFMQNYTL